MYWQYRSLFDGRQLPLHIEFADFVPSDRPIAGASPDRPPSCILEIVRGGSAVLMQGDFQRIDAVWRYLAHNSQKLAIPKEQGGDRFAKTHAIRAALHRVLVEIEGDSVANITNIPDLSGLTEWIDNVEELRGETFLLPFRRLQRIITDMRRQREGLEIKALGERIIVLPHVYVPSDQSVIDIFAENAADDVKDKDVLDMGTGTGVLALTAARLGAKRVAAVDINLQAIENARRNVELLCLQHKIEVKEAGDLFAPVEGETFDLIVFNPPWIEGRAKTLYDTAIYDEGHQTLRRFLRELLKFLRPDGMCLIILSNATDLIRRGGTASLLQELSAEAGLEVSERARVSRVGRLFGARERVRLIELRRRPHS